MSDSTQWGNLDIEQQKNKASAKPLPKYWKVLGLLVFAHAVFGHYCNPMGATEEDYSLTISYIMMSLLVTQPILFALWAAFAPQRFYQRFLWAFLLCTLVSFFTDLGALKGDITQIGSIMFIDSMLFILGIIILLPIRHFFGWQIEHLTSETKPCDYQTYQFGIKHLLILTTITAVAFALFRCLLLINPDFDKTIGSIVNVISFTCLFFAILFPVILVAWVTLKCRVSLIRPMFFVLIALIVIDPMIFLILQRVDPSPSNNSVQFIVSFQFGSALSVLVSTLVLRLCGFRLVRRKTA